MPFRIEATGQRVPPLDKRPDQEFQELARREVAVASIEVRNTMRRVTPTGGTGLTRQGWQIQAPKRRGQTMAGRVFNSTVSAIVLDQGAKPHFPPAGSLLKVGRGLRGRKQGRTTRTLETEPALGQWIRRVLGIVDDEEVHRVAFLIGRRFRAQGIEPRRIFTDAWRALRPELDRRMRELGDKLIAKISEGR